MASHRKKDRAKQLEKARKRRAKRLERRGRPDEEPIVIVSPPGVEKMSVVLEEFVEPYMEDCKTPETVEKLLSLGTIAWNAALVSGSEREDLLNSMLSEMPAEIRDDARSILLELVHRKETYFADNQRFILDFQLVPGAGGEPRLNVISSMPTA
ncbi:MAG TPA: hypothetical protein VFA18_07745 [Gemmataceae bacterium]|nr:hypothetical protein [Gemmataceae bacterium]